MTEKHRNHITLLPSEIARIRYIGVEPLAQKTGLSRDTIYRALGGQVRRKSYDRIKAVLDADGTRLFVASCFMEAVVTVTVSANNPKDAFDRAKEKIANLAKTCSTNEIKLGRMTSPLSLLEEK